jgi:multiple sugar transport system permease protein
MRAFRRYLKTRRMTTHEVPIWIIGMLVAVLWIAPFGWMLSTSLKPEAQIMTPNVEWIPNPITWDNYAKVFELPIVRWAFNSLVVAVIATVLGVTLGAMAGYALARLNFPGKGVIFAVLLGSLMIPTELSVVPLFIGFLKIGLVNNYGAIVLPSIASVFSVYLFRQFFMGLPQEIEDAAIVDGANRFQIFLHVALPLARSPMVASTILLFTANWNAYLWPLLITFTDDMKTMPVGVAEFSPASGSYTQISSFGPGMAAVTLLSLPSLAIFLLLQRYFIEGITHSGIKG